MPMDNEPKLCWICQKCEADSAEHLVKKTDVLQYLGAITPSDRAYKNFYKIEDYASALEGGRFILQNASEKEIIHFEGRSFPIKSANSKPLKGLKTLCRRCNDTLTQPFDASWEKLSAFLHSSLDRSNPVKRIDARTVFGNRCLEELSNVHLYFAKFFGCYAKSVNAPIATESLSQAIRTNKACNYLYLQFCASTISPQFLGLSEIIVEQCGQQNKSATCLYGAGNFAVVVTFASENLIIKNRSHLWHPRTGVLKPTFTWFNE